jgi:hypothetical protein
MEGSLARKRSPFRRAAGDSIGIWKMAEERRNPGSASCIGGGVIFNSLSDCSIDVTWTDMLHTQTARYFYEVCAGQLLSGGRRAHATGVKGVSDGRT